MKIGAVIMLVVALVLGGLSVFAARNWIERQIAGSAAVSKPQADTIKIVVARTRLNFGDKIKDEHLSEINWPKASVPTGSFNSVRQVLDGKRPRVALRRIEVNEPLLKSKISGFGGRATLSAVLKGDRRAVTVRVNAVTGVSGFLLPGDRVDILMSRDESKGSGKKTSVLLQDIRILGVGQLASERHDKPVVVRTITVEATPNEAQKLILAQQVGKLSLMLRPVTERTVVRIRPVTIADLTRDQSDPSRLNPPKPDTKKKVVVAGKMSKKFRLPRRDPNALIGIRRGLRYSTQRVPHEAAPRKKTGGIPLPRVKGGATPGKTNVKPGSDSGGIPTPSGAPMQSGMMPNMPEDQPGGGVTP
jgi:pilus assembly protein CpaB